MNYTLIDENGEIQGELNIPKNRLPKLMERLTEMSSNLSELALLKPPRETLLEQMKLLAEQSKSQPHLSAENAEAMCMIAQTLKEV